MATDAKFQPPTDGADNAPTENNLPVLFMKSCNIVDCLTTTMFVLGAHTSKKVHNVTNAGSVNATRHILTEFIIARGRYGFRQTAAKQLGPNGTKVMLYKDVVIL